MSDAECDRLWSALDKANQYMEKLEARVLRLETTRAPRCPTRQVGDYLPDPGRDDLQAKLDRIRDRLLEVGVPDAPRCTAEDAIISVLAEVGITRPFTGKATDSGHSYRGKLAMVENILGDMLPPSGIPSPAQRLMLRIKAVVDGPSSVVDNSKGEKK